MIEQSGDALSFGGSALGSLDGAAELCPHHYDLG
jgi:hypothetical protein